MVDRAGEGCIGGARRMPSAADRRYEAIWFFGSYQAFQAAAAGPIFG